MRIFSFRTDWRLSSTSRHRVAVMYLGRIVEVATAADLYAHAAASLHAGVAVGDSRFPIQNRNASALCLQGDVPTPINPPSGCRFRTRCPIAIDECARIDPELREILPGHTVACIRVPGWEVAAAAESSRQIKSGLKLKPSYLINIAETCVQFVTYQAESNIIAPANSFEQLPDGIFSPRPLNSQEDKHHERSESETSSHRQPSARPAEAGMSTAQTLTSIFFEPGETFQALRVRPRFPDRGHHHCPRFHGLLHYVCVGGSGSEAIARAQIEAAAPDATPEQIEQGWRCRTIRSSRRYLCVVPGGLRALCLPREQACICWARR